MMLPRSERPSPRNKTAGNVLTDSGIEPICRARWTCPSMIRTQTRLQYANGYLDLGMTREAAQELDSISPEDRGSTGTLTMRVRLYLESKKWFRMELTAKELAEREPENPFGWVNWAYALRERNRITDARSVAEAGLEFVPKDAILWFNYACYCSLLGDVEEASEYLDKAISLDKRFEAESVSDTDLDNLWKWIHSQDSKAEA